MVVFYEKIEQKIGFLFLGVLHLWLKAILYTFKQQTLYKPKSVMCVVFKKVEKVIFLQYKQHLNFFTNKVIQKNNKFRKQNY